MAGNPIKPDKWKILSLVDDSHPPTGVTDHGLESAPVRLNQLEQDWEFASRPSGGGYLSIGRFKYTRIDSGDREAVVATVDPSSNTTWFMIHSESQDAEIITVDREGTNGWTVEGANEGSPDEPRIVIQPIVVLESDPPKYLPSQLFRVVPAPE